MRVSRTNATLSAVVTGRDLNLDPLHLGGAQPGNGAVTEIIDLRARFKGTADSLASYSSR